VTVANYNDPKALTDPQYAALLASLGLSDEQARSDAIFYGQRNQRDQGRVLPEMQRNDAIADKNLGLGYESRGFARSSARQDDQRNLDASQGYALESAQLGFTDRGVDLDRALAASLADHDRQRATAYQDTITQQYAADQLARADEEARTRAGAPTHPYVAALESNLYGPTSGGSHPMPAGTSSPDSYRDLHGVPGPPNVQPPRPALPPRTDPSVPQMNAMPAPQMTTTATTQAPKRPQTYTQRKGRAF
jgi:hypothetical protein